jgi:hypothetical protein
MARDLKNELVDLTDEQVEVVKLLLTEYEKEDRSERDLRRPLWMKLESYFNGLQRIYYDMVAKDYKLLDQGINGTNNLDARHYDKVINIYRAHAESIIAALSIKTPSAIFYPDDAEVEEDIVTAHACVKIKENIESFNSAQLIMIKSLLILFNQGMVAAYIYNRKDSSYGTFARADYGDDKMLYTVQNNCPECGSNIDEVMFEDSVGKVEEETKTCPVCGYTGIPMQEQVEELVPTIIGSTLHPKSKTCIEVFSPLFVYVPFYARKQEHIPYLKLKFEQHYSALKNLYPKLKKKGFTSSIDTQNAEERGIQVGVNNENLSTVECVWVRNWGMDLIDEKEEVIKELKKLYPDGFYAVKVDDQIVEIHNESLDAHWQISENPLSTYLHADPLGKILAPIQDLRNEVVDLGIETMEHAIPETHARSDVMDFKKYGKEEAKPGMIYPANPPADGTPLSAAFHTIKTASLSEENAQFLKFLDENAQFTTHDFPSIHGGPATTGSKTAREYLESKSMALQSLGLTWTVLKFFWAAVMSKAVPLNIHALRQTGSDEKIVVKTNTGFVNNWIRQTDLIGKIGKVEADTDEEMPMTPSQLKGLLVELMTLKSVNIDEAIYHPQNTPLVKRALGAVDFYIPGSDERDKQYAEFVDLLNGIPVVVSFKVDNHAIEAETCRSFLVSPSGLMIKKNNPEGYAAIEMHMMEHQDAEKMLMMEQQQTQPAPGAVNPEGVPENVQQ